jgi:two-component system chemotaxis response regulator CheY
VITDVKMPNMDGLSFIEKIRRELGNRTIPIVIISTKGDESDIERGIRAGANAYLLKPVSIIRLREIVTKLVDLQ